MKAFPAMYKHPTTGLIIEEKGMDLRDYIAIHILPTIIKANLDLIDNKSLEEINDLMEQNVIQAFKYADLYLTHKESQK